jgi:hypothetical protein
MNPLTSLTFKPSLLENLSLRLRWVESQLRCDWLRLRIRDHERLTNYTSLMQVITRKLLADVRSAWSASHMTWGASIYGEQPELETTCTTELTPALLFLHARLSLELSHYNRVNQKALNKLMAEMKQDDRTTHAMLPSWEQWRLRRVTHNREREEAWGFTSTLSSDAGSIGESVYRILFAAVLISGIGSFIAYGIANFQALIIFVASAMAGSGLSFAKAYGGLGIALYVALSIILITFLELFHKPDTQALYDFMVELDEQTRQRLDQISKGLEQIDHQQDEVCPFNFATRVNVRQEENISNG